MKLVLGTRASRLARAQATWVAEQLADSGLQVEVRTISTEGDRDQRAPFLAIGQPGIFVRDLEQALIRGEVDLAVHSYKDLPTVGPRELVVAAVPLRAPSADCLVVRPEALSGPADSPIPLSRGGNVGTASARRAALLHSLRPDLEVRHLRGNVPTRLAKLRRGESEDGPLDAIVLAAAGLERLRRAGALESAELPECGLHEATLAPHLFVPAPAQGALALQVRKPQAAARDREIFDAVARLDHFPSRQAVDAERRFLLLVEGGCSIACGAWCRAVDEAWQLDAVLERNGQLWRVASTGPDPEGLADQAFGQLPEATRRMIDGGHPSDSEVSVGQPGGATGDD